MIKINTTSKYKTFFWKEAGSSFDILRKKTFEVRIFGLKIYKKEIDFDADYIENNGNKIGFK